MIVRPGPLLALLVAATLAGCVKSGTYRKSSRPQGTCDGACRHYMACKRLENGEIFEACLLECREIFVEDGTPDSESLSDFEKLACDDTIAFVEGESGRTPGEEPKSAAP